MASLFLRSYEASMAQYTDAPEVFHRAAAYSIFGTLMTRWKYRCRLQGGSPARWSNLWVLLVGDSGEGRKSTAVRMAEDVLMDVDSSVLAPHDGSPEGFLQDLVKKEQQMPGNAATVIIQPEFTTLLASFKKSYALSLKPLLMDFYDVPNIFKKALSKSSFLIPSPRVSMLGAIATELLPVYSEQEDWLGGFFSRTMIIKGERSRTCARAKTPPDEIIAKHAQALRGVMKRWRNSQVSMTPARPLLDYDGAGAKAAALLPPLPEEENLRGSLTRGSVHLMKCAAIEQIDENPEARAIGRAAVERAMELVLHWWNTVPDVIDQCYARGRGEFEGDRLAKRIYRYVLKQQERSGEDVAWIEVMRSCAIHTDHMSRAVDSLVQAGMLQKPRSDGESAESFLRAVRLRPRYDVKTQLGAGMKPTTKQKR